MSKICPNCNTECSDYVRFCTSCGTALDSSSEVVDVEATIVDDESKMTMDDIPEAPQPQFSGFEQSAQATYDSSSINYATQSNAGSQALAIVSMVLGILSLVCCCCRWLSVVMAIAAVVCGIINLVTHKNGKGMAIAGIVCGGIGLLATIIIIIMSASSLALLNSMDYSDLDYLVEEFIEEFI